MPITNEDNIQHWSRFDASKIKEIPEDGDEARQLLLNPAILNLLGDISGKTVLDAGCGNGYLCRMLAKRGATVVGLEPAEILFQHCLQREQDEPLGITYIQEDLSHPDTNLADFDFVVSNMVLMDIPEYIEALRVCIDALEPGGIFVFSLSHPCFPGWEDDWESIGHVEISEYFEETSVQATYGNNFFRPLSNYLNFLLDNKCAITRVVEPRYSASTLEQFPEKKHARNAHVPQFIVIRAQRSN